MEKLIFKKLVLVASLSCASLAMAQEPTIQAPGSFDYLKQMANAALVTATPWCNTALENANTMWTAGKEYVTSTAAYNAVRDAAGNVMRRSPMLQQGVTYIQANQSNAAAIAVGTAAGLYLMKQGYNYYAARSKVKNTRAHLEKIAAEFERCTQNDLNILVTESYTRDVAPLMPTLHIAGLDSNMQAIVDMYKTTLVNEYDRTFAACLVKPQGYEQYIERYMNSTNSVIAALREQLQQVQ